MSDDETITEDNVEYYIMEAIRKYGKTNFVDCFFWRQMIVLLTQKYGINSKFNEELQRQRKERKRGEK